MRVVIASGIFPPDIGGPATHAAELALALRARGHQVTVLSLTDGGRTERGPGLVRHPRQWAWPVRSAAAGWWLIRHRRDIDVVYAAGLDLPVVAGARLARRPVVLKVPGDRAWERGRRLGLTDLGFDEFQEGSGGPPRLRAMRSVRSWTARQASTVVVPSRYLEDVVERWVAGRTPVTVIRNAVVAPALRSGRSARPAGGLRLVFVGRLVAHKRVDVLLDALTLTDQSVTLDIVGTGPEEKALRARVEEAGLADRVRFVGAVAHDEAMAWMAAADALVSATTYEGLPHVVIEALLAGTPVVTTPAGGVVEVIIDRVNGRLVDPGDAPSFAAVIDDLRRHPEALADLSAGAVASGREWGFERCASEVEDLLYRVSGAADRRPDARQRPKAVYLGRRSVPWPPGDVQKRKLAIHARRFRQLSISTGPAGLRQVAGVRALFLPPLWPPLGAALFYGVGPLVAVAAAAGHGPRVVVCQSPFEGLGVVLARTLLPRRLRPLVQIELHGDWRTATRLYGSTRRRLLAPLADRLAAWSLRRADRVRAVSVDLEDLAREVGYAGPLDRHVTYSEFDVFLEPPCVDPPDRPTAAFVGVLERYKAVDVLLDAWPAVVARVPDAELVLVGAGSMRDQLRARLEDDQALAAVRPLDPMPQADLAALLDRSTCLVLPSRSEGLPRIVLEAMARGRAVVASDVGGMRELVDSSTGRLVPAEDTLALADALVEILDDRRLAVTMGVAGRRRAEQRQPAVEYEAGIDRLVAWVQGSAPGAAGVGPLR